MIDTHTELSQLQGSDTYNGKRVTYYWEINANSKYKTSQSSRQSFIVCTPSTPSIPVLNDTYDQNDSSITLRWESVIFAEECNQSKDVGYEVYFFGAGYNHTSVSPVFVNETEYTIDGVTDGKYHFAVRAKNVNKYSEISEYMNLSICIPRGPSVPSLWYPMSDSFVRIRGGFYVDVSKVLDKGSQCNIEKNEPYTPPSYKLQIGPYAKTIYENVTNTTLSYSKEVYRFHINETFEYNSIPLTITYTNSDGINASTGILYIIPCDKPLPTYAMEPKDNAADLNKTVVLKWNYTRQHFGLKCVLSDKFSVDYIVRLYVDYVNITELMESQGVNDTDDLDFSGLEPSTNVYNETDSEKKTTMFSFKAQLGATYIWRTEAYNDYESTFSDTYVFTITNDFCKTTNCSGHGVCSTELKTCSCEEGFGGDECENPVPRNKSNSVLGAALGGSLGGIVLIAIIIALILFLLMRKSGRKRVVLEGPGGDIRFSRVKVPMAGRDAPEEETAAIEQQIREDCERLQNGAAPEEAFVFAQEYRTKIKSDGIDESVKAVLYAYYRFGYGRELLKLFISGEVNNSQKPETLFRQNSPASTMFKHWSKIVGLDYLFACFSDILKGLLQHEVDAANDKKSDVSLQLFNDTCEVDPTRIEDDEDVEELLAVNAIQLSLTVQRFATQIYRSVPKIPYEIKDICIHIYSKIEAAYPGHGVRGVSAFLFLRFYSVSISVPEVYGLLRGEYEINHF